MKTIQQTKTIPVQQTVDVLVAGGGIAGAAAALAAARQGKKVLLCEREYLLGGLATVGMVAVYLPIDDGNGRQVSYGIAEELLRLSVKDGPTDYLYCGKNNVYYPEVWLTPHERSAREGTRFRTHYNPWTYALDLETLLLKAGVEILYGTWVADARVEDGRITHVILENIDGRVAVAVNAAVDATGDAVLARAAGEKTAVWSCGNVHSFWHISHHGGKLDLVGFSEKIPLPNKPLEPGKTAISGLDARENSRFLRETHEQYMAFAAEKKKEDPTTQPAAFPTIPDHRMTRRIAGQSPCEKEHEGRRLADSVGCFGNWHRADGGYEVPYGSLFGSEIENLFAAGRCSAASDDMWDLTRVIPVCAVTGEAAGIAAALTGPRRAELIAVQTALAGRGVRLHLEDC